MSDESRPQDGSPSGEPQLKGVDLARRALEEARAAAKASGKAFASDRVMLS